MANQSSSKSYNIETILAHTATLSAKQRAFQAQNKDTLYEDVGILFCKICNCAVDHSRQSCFDQHKKTKKHQDNKKVPQKKQKTITTSFAVQNAAYFSAYACRVFSEIFCIFLTSLLQSHNNLQISVMFNTLFEKRRSHQKSSRENKVWIQSDGVGNEVEFILEFNCSSGKCSVILRDVPPEVHPNFLGFIAIYPACRPAACKKFCSFN